MTAAKWYLSAAFYCQSAQSHVVKINAAAISNFFLIASAYSYAMADTFATPAIHPS